MEFVCCADELDINSLYSIELVTTLDSKFKRGQIVPFQNVGPKCAFQIDKIYF